MSRLLAKSPATGWLPALTAALGARIRDFAGAGGGSTHLWPRWLVLRAVGVVYLFVFGGILAEAPALIGPQGIAPIEGFLAHVREAHPGLPGAFFRTPSLFWFESGGGMIEVLGWTGMTAAIAVVLNLWPRLALFLCWLVFLSFVSVFHVFSPTQMDQLMLETALLCIPYAPRGIRPGLGEHSPPWPIALFMMRWLLFRVMFESGVIKLLSGEPRWRDFTAMEVMYETAPFPTILGYLDHQLSHAYHLFEVGLTFMAELVAPLLAVFGGRRGRWTAFWSWIAFQTGIQLTANFGWLNTAAIGLGLLLLDDGMLAAAADRLRLRRLADWLRRKAVTHPVSAPAGWKRRLLPAALWTHFGLTLYAFGISCVTPVSDFSYDKARPLRYAFLDFKSANSYTLYETFLEQRLTVEFAGSNDGGQTWRIYPYRHLPQFEERVSGFIAPRFLRFEATVQIVGSTGEATPFLPLVASHLLAGNPAVVGLFAENPFPDRPPTMIRQRLYRLVFTDRATWRASGKFWHKTYLGEYAPMLHRTADGRVQLAVTVLDVERAKAEAGNPEAQSNLGFMFASGRGASRRPAEAVEWFRRAAEQGWAEARYNLGVMLAEGNGVAADSAQAATWFRLAAGQGHPKAQFEFGVCLANGDGVPRDEIEALAWFTVAAANHAEAARYRDMLAEQIEPAGLIKARLRSEAILAEIKAFREGL